MKELREETAGWKEWEKLLVFVLFKVKLILGS